VGRQECETQEQHFLALAKTLLDRILLDTVCLRSDRTLELICDRDAQLGTTSPLKSRLPEMQNPTRNSVVGVTGQLQNKNARCPAAIVAAEPELAGFAKSESKSTSGYFEAVPNLT
jgi:hypothetical protein